MRILVQIFFPRLFVIRGYFIASWLYLPIQRLLKITATLAWSFFFCWAMTIFILSSCTGDDLQIMPPSLLEMDKLIHAIAFGAGAILLALSLRLTAGWRRGKLFWATLLGIAVFGALDEIHQLFTPGRSGADFFDWVADVTGCAIAASIYCFIYERSHGTPPAPASHPGPGPNSGSPHGD